MSDTYTADTSGRRVRMLLWTHEQEGRHYASVHRWADANWRRRSGFGRFWFRTRNSVLCNCQRLSQDGMGHYRNFG